MLNFRTLALCLTAFIIPATASAQSLGDLFGAAIKGEAQRVLGPAQRAAPTISSQRGSGPPPPQLSPLDAQRLREARRAYNGTVSLIPDKNCWPGTLSDIRWNEGSPNDIYQAMIGREDGGIFGVPLREWTEAHVVEADAFIETCAPDARKEIPPNYFSEVLWPSIIEVRPRVDAYNAEQNGIVARLEAQQRLVSVSDAVNHWSGVSGDRKAGLECLKMNFAMEAPRWGATAVLIDRVEDSSFATRNNQSGRARQNLAYQGFGLITLANGTSVEKTLRCRFLPTTGWSLE